MPLGPNPIIITAGSAGAPSLGISSETSLGFYRSAASTMAQSYGTFAVVQGVVVGGDTALVAQNLFRLDNTGTAAVNGGTPGASANIILFGGTATQANEMRFRQGTNIRGKIAVGTGSLTWIDGTALAPGYGFSSESSLGYYLSGASTIAQSYGTFDLTAAIASLGTIRVKSGANNSCGTAVLGSNGSVNVANTYVKTGDLIFLTDQTAGGTLGDLELGGIRNSSGFTILSTSLTDTSTVAWLIIRPG